MNGKKAGWSGLSGDFGARFAARPCAARAAATGSPCEAAVRRPEARSRAHRHGLALLGALAVSRCATGAAVSDEELAELEAAARAQGQGPAAPIISGGASPGGTAGGGSGQTPAAGPGGSLSGGGSSSEGAGGNLTVPPAEAGGGGGGVIESPPLSGGSCGGGAVAPTAVGGCSQTGQVSVLYSDTTGSTDTDQLRMTLSVENAGPSFNLSDLVIRYWFTADGRSNFTGEIDYASVDGVCVNFGDQQGSGFADVAFASSQTVGADGIREVQVRIHTSDYARLDQGNDFSFMAGAMQAANQNLTVYVAGERVAGCEPEGI